MKFYILTLISLFLVTPAVAGQPLDIQVLKGENETLRFQRIVASRTDDGVRIHGRITANRPQLLPEGHVDIATYTSDGTLISETTATVSPKTLSRRTKRQGGVRFTGTITGDTPKDVTIKIAYHRLDRGESELNHFDTMGQQ